MLLCSVAAAAAVQLLVHALLKRLCHGMTLAPRMNVTIELVRGFAMMIKHGRSLGRTGRTINVHTTRIAKDSGLVGGSTECLVDTKRRAVIRYSLLGAGQKGLTATGF